MIDTRVIHALHVERLRKADMAAELDAVAGAIYQTSTLDAILDGAYDGDVTIAELAERGDLGLGTLDGLDGEMIVLDGEFHQARADGSVRRVGPDELTPFAVVTRFRARHARDRRLPLRPRAAARDARHPRPRHRPLLRRAHRRPLRVGAGAIGAAPASPLPAVRRSGRAAGRVRAGRARGLDRRLPLPRLRAGPERPGLPPARHLRRTVAPAGTCSTAASPRPRSTSTTLPTCTSSFRRESASPTPTPRPPSTTASPERRERRERSVYSRRASSATGRLAMICTMASRSTATVRSRSLSGRWWKYA